MAFLEHRYVVIIILTVVANGPAPETFKHHVNSQYSSLNCYTIVAKNEKTLCSNIVPIYTSGAH
jgi:hypothetical protein